VQADLHFFKKQEQAVDFQEFNGFQFKDIGISASSDVWQTIKDITRQGTENRSQCQGNLNCLCTHINTVSALNDLLQLGQLKG
jgi:hypothetical protein